ncbi:hypothetical protein BT96DRAFT_933597 [Gymnopus androsaceus JB14]|uniref:Uncharacterized protein n=1 Tax=Gymnopus androsaceus JB14 TaxID=1447944 RepID=A0A6A4IDV3_9AGAR|nr:hypothetical protein BT96DRAFT_933597 [Gymnopus androsaceus JB14]
MPAKGAVVSPPRKKPHCTKCKRPKAGHPRSGCPFVANDKNADTDSNNIADALGFLTISDGTEPTTLAQRKGRHSWGATPSVPVEFEDMQKVLRGRRKTEVLALSQTLDSPPDSELEMSLIPGENDGSGADDGQETSRKGEVHCKDRLEMLSAGGTITTEEINDENADTDSNNSADAYGRRSLGVTTPSVPVEFEDMKKVLRGRRRSEKTAAFARSQTLDSLPDSELEMLLIPGENDGLTADDGQETSRKGVHWTDRLEMLLGKRREVLPGTLATPWSSSDSVPDDQRPGITSSSSNASTQSTDKISSTEVVSPSSISAPRPPARTMSMEQRAGYMNHLEELSTAKAYMVSNADLAVLKEQPPKGLYTKILTDDDGRNVVVVGRDEESTEELYQTFNAEKKRAGNPNLSSAAGTVVGAVATFTALAAMLYGGNAEL